jgi:hypothetical protein
MMLAGSEPSRFAFTYLIALARANLLIRSRCVEITFERVRAQLRDARADSEDAERRAQLVADEAALTRLLDELLSGEFRTVAGSEKRTERNES